jgi:aerobic-type carbon monoxide dehydrogenase small subunit (CoxS/CutS family)
MPYELEINGERVSVDAPGLEPLARILRDHLGLTGTKTGCFEGRCGACTVIVDGRTVVSCLYPLALAEGAAVRTVEGLADGDGRLSPLQDALLEAGGVQCGISTPGILMTLTWLLEQNPAPSEPEVRAALAGNVCRCTGYQKIVDAVLEVVRHGGRR